MKNTDTLKISSAIKRTTWNFAANSMQFLVTSPLPSVPVLPRTWWLVSNLGSCRFLRDHRCFPAIAEPLASRTFHRIYRCYAWIDQLSLVVTSQNWSAFIMSSRTCSNKLSLCLWALSMEYSGAGNLGTANSVGTNSPRFVSRQCSWNNEPDVFNQSSFTS